MKKFIFRVLLGYGALALLVVLAFFMIGFRAAGLAGAWNAVGTGLLFSAMGLPMAGLLIALKFWGGYANRWGNITIKRNWKANQKTASTTRTSGSLTQTEKCVPFAISETRFVKHVYNSGMQPPKKPSPLKLILIVLLVYGVSAILILLLSSLIGFWLNGSEGASFGVGVGLMINLLIFPTMGFILIARLRSLSDTSQASPSEEAGEQNEEVRSE